MSRLVVSIIVLTLIAVTAWGVSWIDDSYIIDMKPRDPLGAGINLPEFSLNALVLAAVYGATLAFALVGGRVWQFFATLPGRIRERRSARRKERGYQALTRGLAAVAAGDARESASLARSSKALLQDQRLTALLAAQSAQLQGREDVASDEFKILLQDEDTAFLGLRGLATQALRQGREVEALRHVKAAQALRPDAPWVLDLLYRLELREGNAKGSIAALEASRAKGLIARDEVKIRLAPLYSHEAKFALGEDNFDKAARLAAKALDAMPGYLPAALIRGQALVALGNLAQARTFIRKAWKLTPHPDLVDLYLAASKAGKDEKKIRNAGLALFKGSTSSRDAQVTLGAFMLKRLDLEAAEQALQRAQAGGSLRAVRLLAIIPKLQKILDEAPRAERDGAGEGGETLTARRERVFAMISVAMEEPEDSTWVCASCGTVHEEWNLKCGSCETNGLIEWQDRNDRRVIRPEDAPFSPKLLSSLN